MPPARGPANHGTLTMTELELRNLKNRLNIRLNNYLVEMEPGYDDSITGFNMAWDLMGEMFDELIANAIGAQEKTP